MKILKIILALVLLAVVSYLVDKYWSKNSSDIVVENNENQIVEMCFGSFGQPNEVGYYDRYTLRMSIDNENDTVTGELNFLPAEKDSKVGLFEGTVSEVDKTMMARTVSAWWGAMAEGTTNKEELSIIFGEGTASIGMGEMEDRGDGVYVYKNKESINFTGLTLSDISCIDLTERESVGDYLRANLSALSAVQPVLGGSWYMTSYSIDTSTNTGSVMYEDGHIQEDANFSYDADVFGNVINLRFVDGGES